MTLGQVWWILLMMCTLLGSSCDFDRASIELSRNQSWWLRDDPISIAEWSAFQRIIEIEEREDINEMLLMWCSHWMRGDDEETTVQWTIRSHSRWFLFFDLFSLLLSWWDHRSRRGSRRDNIDFVSSFLLLLLDLILCLRKTRWSAERNRASFVRLWSTMSSRDLSITMSSISFGWQIRDGPMLASRATFWPLWSS